MDKLEWFILHCLETPPRLRVTKDDLEEWHMGPKDLKPSGVRYLGKTYSHRDELPDNMINGKPIKNIHGRGWDRLGYALMVHRDGEPEILTPYDDDEFVDPHEITWGVAGINRRARHIALEGGLGAGRDNDFFQHFTDEQFLYIQKYLKVELAKHPGVTVGGHNDFTDQKDCPGFQVFDLLQLMGLEKYALHGYG